MCNWTLNFREFLKMIGGVLIAFANIVAITAMQMMNYSNVFNVRRSVCASYLLFGFLASLKFFLFFKF